MRNDFSALPSRWLFEIASILEKQEMGKNNSKEEKGVSE
jgi:hypothetical protein